VERRLEETLVETWLWARYQTTTGRLKFDGGIHTDLASMVLRGFSLFLIQPRVNVSYALSDAVRLKASYGRFSQNMITVNNEDDVIALFDAWIPIPENLEPEQSDHYVVGVDWTVARELSAGLQGYYKDYTSLVTYNQDKVDANDPDYINSTGQAYGGEVLLRYGLPSVDMYLAYTLGWTTIESNGFTYAPRYDRRHSLNIMGILRPLERVEISARWEYGSGLPYTQTAGYYDRFSLEGVFEGSYVNETGEPYTILGEKNTARLPAYHRLDLSATYHFALGRLRGSFGVSIINVYDHENIIYYDRDSGQTITMLSFFPSATLTVEY
jgi:outer membrane receptor for ferrienterochelin and colicin